MGIARVKWAKNVQQCANKRKQRNECNKSWRGTTMANDKRETIKLNAKQGEGRAAAPDPAPDPVAVALAGSM